jgi:hypothetical protein
MKKAITTIDKLKRVQREQRIPFEAAIEIRRVLDDWFSESHQTVSQKRFDRQVLKLVTAGK